MQVTLGNGIVTRHTYQEDMHYLDSIITSNNLQNLSYTYDKFGNLAARKDNRRNMTESFTYDDMNRLKTISMGGLTANMTYDGLGRMTSKQAIVGNNRSPQVKQVFTAPVFDATKIHAVSEATTMPGVFPEEDQDIEYTSFDKVSYIQEGDNHLSYSYGFNEQRIGMNEEVDGMIRTKIYTGNCEFVTANGQQKTLTYLTSPYGVFAVVEKQGEDESLHFVLKDHLGSWTVITDENGEVEQEVSFDAWGNLRNPETWTNYSENETYEEPMFDRGYTGHEHLAAFGLINMNGRMYDPFTSGFLSVDNYVQSPDYTQSFNRYAYCLNNPLKYTDPDGEFPWVPMLIGAGIGVVTNGIDNVCNNQSFFQGAGKAALFGGLQGLASFGIGQVASGIASVGGRVAFQTLAHGTLGGVSTTLNGGNFGTGFLSGAASSLVATGMGSLTQTTDKWGQAIGVIGGGAIAGGVSSSICGGSFWDGFRNGAISSGLNHAVHAGVFGKGLAIASMTGRTRHLWGPDAKAYAGSLEVSAGIATSAEVGGIEIFVGKYKGFHPYSEIGMGAGGLSTSLGVDMIEMYSTSSVSEVQLDDFSGSFEKISLSGTVLPFVSIGASASISYHQGNANNLGFTIGIGHSVSLDPMPVNANFTITHGASKAGSFDGLTNELRKSFKIRR